MVVTNNSTRLTIAVQKSGRLSTASLTLLEACGFRFSLHEAKLLAHCQNQPVDLLRVRDDDIPGLVMDGIVDLGLVGENVLVSTGATLEANGLVEREVIFRSQAQMIQRPTPLSANKQDIVNQLLPRIDGVQQARESKYIMLHAPHAALLATLTHSQAYFYSRSCFSS